MSRNQNRGSELGTRGRHTSTPVLADELLGFKSKHRTTIYTYWISEEEQKLFVADEIWGF